MVARILVAEGHAPSLVLMLHLLKGNGYSTVFATEGSEALRLAREERPDLIVCQWGLSSANGSEIGHHIQKDEHLRGVPLIAVFEASFAEIGGRRTPPGFVGHVVKPIIAASFIRTVERHLPAALRASRTPVRPPGRRRRSDPM
ncbi:MAG: response regulator [Rhodocyclales bacterium]|nr:response regulator [Rhodocyclales bacterium]